ncbi:MAG: sigma-54 interaction domain-containing protein [Thermodesulfobacteriota bacterium]
MGDQISQYWKSIVDTMMDGLVVVDTEGTIVSVNRAMEELTGYTRKELIGQPCTILDCDVCLVSGPMAAKEKKCDLFRTGQVSRRRCELRRKDARPLYVLKNAVVLRDGEGQIIGGVETLTDLTDLVAKEREIAELKEVLAGEEGFHGIIGNSPVMRALYEMIRNAARSDAPVIIYGESGTGKELVANAIHALGRRARRPFVKINCAALNEALLESELFGHFKGAFTGADRYSKGRFEAANGGDLVLDEIGDISLSTQVKLLRVLQEKEIERVGDQRTIRIDVRVMAATHQDLHRLIEEGRFREDLYYRLNVIPIAVPPLRERAEDIPLLTDHLVRRLRVRTDKPIQGLEEASLEALMKHHWPGNVRELVNVIEYAFVVCNENLISPQHLPPHIGGAGVSMGFSRRDMEREDLLRALAKAKGRKGEAARLLGVSRVTLWKWMKRYGIEMHPRASS